MSSVQTRRETKGQRPWTITLPSNKRTTWLQSSERSKSTWRWSLCIHKIIRRLTDTKVKLCDVIITAAQPDSCWNQSISSNEMEKATLKISPGLKVTTGPVARKTGVRIQWLRDLFTRMFWLRMTVTSERMKLETCNKRYWKAHEVLNLLLINALVIGMTYTPPIRLSRDNERSAKEMS